jgi:hypothetical protein
MAEVKVRGRLVFSPGGDGIDNSVGKLDLDVGENALLTAELKLWGVDLNEHSTLLVKAVDAPGGPGDIVQSIAGPQSQAAFSIGFTKPARFLRFEAIVAENESGGGTCDFALIA